MDENEGMHIAQVDTVDDLRMMLDAMLIGTVQDPTVSLSNIPEEMLTEMFELAKTPKMEGLPLSAMRAIFEMQAKWTQEQYGPKIVHALNGFKERITDDMTTEQVHELMGEVADELNKIGDEARTEFRRLLDEGRVPYSS